MGNRTVRISKDRQQKMIDLYAAGMSRLNVAAEVGTSIETVTKFLKLNGVDIRPWFEHRIPPAHYQAIIERYRSGERIPALATEFGVTSSTVRKILTRNDVPIRDDRGKVREFTAAEFETMRTMAEGGRSQNEMAQALGSARDTIQGAMLKAGIPPARTGAARGSQHGNWKGGRMVRADGYVEITLPPDSPFISMAKRGNTVLEHRLVMAKALGRPLARHESVHHVNGIHDDNRDENLQLRQGQHGRGAAFRCLDCGSTNIEATTITENGANRW